MADESPTPTAEADEAEGQPIVEPEEGDDAPISKDDDWQAKARKHERDLKKERRDAEALRLKLAEREKADMSEHEKAIAAARDEGKAEASKAARAKLLKAEIRAAAAGKIANPNLALKLIELDDDTAFDDDGEVIREPIDEAIQALLEENPGLAAVPKGSGANDAGKGGAAKAAEDMSVEEHLADIRRKTK